MQHSQSNPRPRESRPWHFREIKWRRWKSHPSMKAWFPWIAANSVSFSKIFRTILMKICRSLRVMLRRLSATSLASQVDAWLRIISLLRNLADQKVLHIRIGKPFVSLNSYNTETGPVKFPWISQKLSINFPWILSIFSKTRCELWCFYHKLGCSLLNSDFISQL